MHWIQDNLLHKRLFFFVSCLRPTKKTSGAENCFLSDLQPIQQFITETVLLPRVHLVKDPHYCYSCPSMLVTITQRTTIILTITNKIRFPTTLQIHQHYCCSLAQHVLACPAKTSSVHVTSKTTEFNSASANVWLCNMLFLLYGWNWSFQIQEELGFQ